ncbi:MAG: thioredoxin family protein [Gemmataceae bacterium]|nr:thioredoxin family protein [Gemmataceae bacterium]MDW8264605.1 thioredoxin family protein [Gemmataceae bacterium]
MNLFDRFQHGLPYDDFLARYGTDAHRQRWGQVFDQVTLTAAQRQLLASFRREMPVLCLAGAWCGDCARQCPVFAHFAAATPTIRLRFLDRDEHPDVQRELQINGGNRVPVVVFFSEDGYEVARYGERTLSAYRQLVRDQLGLSCPTGILPPGDRLLAEVTQEWLNEFERVQWLLRLSARLRQKHGD